MFGPFPPTPPLPPGLAATPGGVPVGTVLAFAGDVAVQVTPLFAQGYLVCDGSPLPVSEFYELFLAIGHQYSPKELVGGGTFLLPDLRGIFLRGVDRDGTVDLDGAATDPAKGGRKLPDGTMGRNVGSVQQCAFQAHEHEYTPGAPSGATAAGDNGTVGAGTAKTSAVVQDSEGKPLMSVHETRPINAYVYYIIKYANNVLRHHLTALSSGAGGGG